jgi:hypothetical protein
MGTRDKTRGKSIQDMLDEARSALGAAKKNLKAFVKADAKKTKKRVTAASLNAFNASLTAFAKARRAGAGKKTQSKSATAAVDKARKALSDEVVSARSDIESTYDDTPNDSIHQSAGRGMNLQTRSASQLLGDVEKITGALGEDPDTAEKAKAAGVDSKRIAKIEALAKTLEESMTTHEATDADSSTLSKGARVILASITKQTTHVRKTAKSVFRGNASVLKQFAPVGRAHAIKHRQPVDQSQILTKSGTGTSEKQTGTGK